MNRLLKKAIQHIETDGFLLVYPIQNAKEPQSLWSRLYPKSKMVWEWTSESDDRVAEMWHLKTMLAQSKNVIYGKYYKNRATFFSKNLFVSLLAYKRSFEYRPRYVEGRQILDLLEVDSPLSTKQIKEMTGLRGKLCESIYNRATKDLWDHLLLVGLGEIDDGAFPSLAHGSTATVFEDLWEESQFLSKNEAMSSLLQLKEFHLIQKWLEK